MAIGKPLGEDRAKVALMPLGEKKTWRLANRWAKTELKNHNGTSLYVDTMHKGRASTGVATGHRVLACNGVLSFC